MANETTPPKTLTERYGIWVMVAVIGVQLLTSILANQKVLTPEQKQSLDKAAQLLLLAESQKPGETTTETITVRESATVTTSPLAPAAPVSESVAKPSSKLRLNITDEAGKRVSSTATAATVDAGELYLVTANVSQVAWAHSSSGQVRLLGIPGVGFAFSITEFAFVEFHATDSALKTVSVRITANHGAQPPPRPVPQPDSKPDPKPDPRPDPQPTNDRVLGLIVFTDKASVDPDVTKVTNSTYWQQLAETHRVATFLRATNDIAGKAFLREVTIPTGNVLLIREDRPDGGEKLACVPMPKTVEALKAELAKWSNR